MYGILLYTVLIWGSIGNAVYAPDSLRPLTPAAYQAIRHTLQKKDQSYVVLDAQGRIDRHAIHGHTSKSPNFQALKTLVNDALVVDVIVSNDYLYRDTHDSTRHGSLTAVYSNELTDATHYMQHYTAAQLKSMGFRDEIRASGPSGITLLPGGEQDVKGDSKGSVNGHIVVVLSSDLTERDAARKLAHEAYGHALFFILRKDPNHAEDKGRGGNQELEDQIRSSIDETERNYDDIKPSPSKKTKRAH
jgi:hypothetical protein